MLQTHIAQVDRCFENPTLNSMLAGLLQLRFDIDPVLDAKPSLWKSVCEKAASVADRAFEDGEPDAELDIQRSIRLLLGLQLFAHDSELETSAYAASLRNTLTKRWLHQEMKFILADDLPDESIEDFSRWFRRELSEHPAVDHPLYRYLAQEADLDDFRFFAAQERTVDAPFVDLIALTQVGAARSWKQEMARNYWDEAGAGDPAHEHAAMFEAVLSHLGVDASQERDLSTGALACANMLFLLAMHRAYRFMSIGALAATESAVPTRFRRLVDAGRRLALQQPVLDYYYMHVVGDEGHADGWLENVIRPTILGKPSAAPQIARGVRLRLNTSRRYCNEVLFHLKQRRAGLANAG